MNWKTLLGGCALVAATALVTTQVVSQDPPTEPTHDPSPDEMMARWMEFMTPGEHHEHLKALVGTWDQEVLMWHSAELEPLTSPGRVEYEVILGGRFVKGTYRSSVMGMEFEGVDIIGYDNLRKEYVSVWMDNMSTSMMITRGNFDSDKNALVMTGTYDDPTTGARDLKVRSVMHMRDDTATFELYRQDNEGESFKNIEIRSRKVDE